ncbi:hypothetical protein MA16_Dca023076 [Dendrobium catenatum]|uniref:Uncharacterized protein n=1 Tax=Dendrobium catenatum TaxID=906689 RepID=A0A2I0VHN7_9ASPA|nr:hypothetical protein MA16_Dca023076 [Dendrobium catenatum]
MTRASRAYTQNYARSSDKASTPSGPNLQAELALASAPFLDQGTPAFAESSEPRQDRMPRSAFHMLASTSSSARHAPRFLPAQSHLARSAHARPTTSTLAATCSTAACSGRSLNQRPNPSC